MIKVLARAFWKGFVAATLAGAAGFLLGIPLAWASYSMWPTLGVTVLFALPAGLFAFLWALRPEASHQDQSGTPGAGRNQ